MDAWMDNWIIAASMLCVCIKCTTTQLQDDKWCYDACNEIQKNCNNIL